MVCNKPSAYWQLAGAYWLETLDEQVHEPEPLRVQVIVSPVTLVFAWVPSVA